MSNKQLTEAVVGFVRLIKANAMGAQIVCDFVVDNLKKGTSKSRSKAYELFFNELTQEWRTTKRTCYKNVTFQRNYANAVNNRANNDTPYVVEPPKGKHWVDGCEGILLQSDTDPEKYYLRISENANTQRITTYYVDGQSVTEEELDVITAHLPKRNYSCNKQIEHGVDADNIVVVKDITLTNIVSIKYGDKCITLR